jgi:hypothetical protein
MGVQDGFPQLRRGHMTSSRMNLSRDHDFAEDRGRRHHLLIAGTGRAGTSALVRYLTALGLESHLSRHGEASVWFDAAQAGLEDLPVSTINRDLPYVVKSPWSYQLVEEVLADPQIELDAVIVPIRDLTEAAASRSILQLQALHQEADWMVQMSTTWEHWGSAPGGIVFSLNPIDQARLLAVGFHRLLERLVQADVPTVLLAFPRLVSDPDYLFGKLSPVLPIEVPIERAREVHAATFSAALVRVEGELSDEESKVSSVLGEFQGPSLRALDNAALRRSLIQLRNQLAEVGASRTALERERDMLRDQLKLQRSRAAEVEHQAAEKDQLQREVLALRESRSWRTTWPLRALSRAMRVGSRSRSV